MVSEVICILRHTISLFYWSVFVGKPIRWWELDRGNSAWCLYYYLRWRRFEDCGLVSFLVVFITIFLSFVLFIVLEITVIHNDDYFQCPGRSTASSHGKDERKIDSIVESQKKLEDANRSLQQENKRLRIELQKKEKQNRRGFRISRRSSTLEIPSELRVSRSWFSFYLR